jgi:hypothetical protein
MRRSLEEPKILRATAPIIDQFPFVSPQWDTASAATARAQMRHISDIGGANSASSATDDLRQK